jgi:hypothetical protein
MSFAHDRKTGSKRVLSSGAGASTAQTVAALAKVRLSPNLPCLDVVTSAPGRRSLLPRPADHFTLTYTAMCS